MSTTEVRSVITCDMEGRIETFSSGAQKMFGYSEDEIVGKKRVSLFSSGLVVLEHVNTWLKTAREKGAYNGRTVFVRKNGERFAADIKITPTFKKGQQIGYCGVTLEAKDVPWEQAMPPISLATRFFAWLVVLRAPFLSATLVPIAVAGAWAAYKDPEPFRWGVFGLCALGAVLLHLCGNTFNDYFDHKSGADEANTEYFLPFSGGSRSIELGLITEKGLLRLSIALLLAAVGVGGALLALTGPMLIAFGAAGAAAGFFYTAPPLRLVARRGLGELTIFLAFGPLMTAGTVFALTGAVTTADFVVGIPLGLLTAAILWINEFPDAVSDEKTGKITLVVALGKEKARIGYVMLLAAAFIAVGVMVAMKMIPVLALAVLLVVPLAWKATVTAFKHFQDRSLVKANAGTIQIHALAGILMALGIAFGPRLPF